MRRVVSSIAVVVLVVLAVPASVGAYLYFSEGGGTAQAATTPVSSIVARGTDLGYAGLNAAIDASGVKEQVDSALRQNAAAIAAELGTSEGDVLAIVDALDIPDWEATELPEDAVPLGTYSVSYGDTQAQITPYADPSYVTVTAYGQDVTFSVPESAQGSLWLVSAF